MSRGFTSVETVEVVYDRVTDRSCRFAFVTMASVEEAEEVIRLFDESLVGVRKLKVNFPEVCDLLRRQPLLGPCRQPWVDPHLAGSQGCIRFLARPAGRQGHLQHGSVKGLWICKLCF